MLKNHSFYLLLIIVLFLNACQKESNVNKGTSKSTASKISLKKIPSSQSKVTFNNFIKENDSIDIRSEIEKYLIHWKWFLLSTVICLGIAVFYAKSKVNIYQTNASILVKEEGGAASELSAFQDLSALGLGGKNNVTDEIEIIKSRTLAEAYVRELNLNMSLFQQQGLKKVEKFTALGKKVFIEWASKPSSSF